MSADLRVIPALDEIQAKHGYPPRTNLLAMRSGTPGVTLHRLHEVASFFLHYRTEPPDGLKVKVCRDLAGHLPGARSITATLESVAAEIAPERVVVGGVSCLGQRDKALVALVGGRLHRNLSTETAKLGVESIVAVLINITIPCPVTKTDAPRTILAFSE